MSGSVQIRNEWTTTDLLSAPAGAIQWIEEWDDAGPFRVVFSWRYRLGWIASFHGELWNCNNWEWA